MEAIRFEVNIPEQMAFSYPTGKEVAGRYGAQFYRGTVDGRAAYLPPIVEKRLVELNLSRGEPVTICKREKQDGAKKSIVWEVKRVEVPEQSVETTPQPPAVTKPISHTQVSAMLTGCMIAAVDSLITTAEYAKSKGIAVDLRLELTAEDLQKLASTAFIGLGKMADLNLRARNEELREWRQ